MSLQHDKPQALAGHQAVCDMPLYTLRARLSWSGGGGGATLSSVCVCPNSLHGLRAAAYTAQVEECSDYILKKHIRATSPHGSGKESRRCSYVVKRSSLSTKGMILIHPLVKREWEMMGVLAKGIEWLRAGL